MCSTKVLKEAGCRRPGFVRKEDPGMDRSTGNEPAPHRRKIAFYTFSEFGLLAFLSWCACICPRFAFDF